MAVERRQHYEYARNQTGKIHDQSSNKDTRLIDLRPLLLSHRIESIDLHCKSVGWFLYSDSIGLVEFIQG